MQISTSPSLLPGAVRGTFTDAQETATARLAWQTGEAETPLLGWPKKHKAQYQKKITLQMLKVRVTSAPLPIHRGS